MMHPQPQSGLPCPLTNQNGIALLIVLLITTGLILLGTFGSYTAQTEVRVALNELLAKQALGLAEGGLSHALSIVTTDEGINEVLAEGTGGELVSLGEIETLDDEFDVNGNPNPKQYRFHATGPQPEDGYYVRLEDNFDETNGVNNPNVDQDNIVRFISRGMVENAERTVETLVQILVGPECAIETRGDLEIGGNVRVSGTNGCAHSNKEMRINGNSSSFSVGPTSSGGMNLTSGITVNGQSIHGDDATAYANEHDDEEQHDIPVVNVLAFGPYQRNLAAEVRAANGLLLNSDGSIQQGGMWSCAHTAMGTDCTVSGGTTLSQQALNDLRWNFVAEHQGKPAHWATTNNSAGGIFFIEGWVDIGGVGSAANPWRATIIATNSIDVTGNPNMAPFATTGRLRNILFVSGNDVRLQGNPQVSYTGAIFAHQQLKVSGNFTMNGFLIAEDAGIAPRRSWPNDPADDSNDAVDLIGKSEVDKFTGNPSITYNGLSTSLLRARLNVRAWREARAQ